MDSNPVWASDGMHIFFISDRGGSSDIWYQPVDNSYKPVDNIKSLTTGVGIESIALSKNGDMIAYTKALDRSNIWSASINENRPLTLSMAKQITTENRVLFHRVANTLNYLDIKTVIVSCGTCMDQLLKYRKK